MYCKDKIDRWLEGLFVTFVSLVGIFFIVCMIRGTLFVLGIWR